MLSENGVGELPNGEGELVLCVCVVWPECDGES